MRISVTVSVGMSQALAFSGGRYEWSAKWPCSTEPGTYEVRESDLWTWRDACDDDDDLFPLVNPDSEAYSELWALYESVL